MNLIRRPLPLLSLTIGLCLAGGGILYAQLEGADRGVPPIASASTFEVTGVEVDVGGKNAQDAREQGWRLAQAKGWKALWASMNKRPQSEAPALPDSVLNTMVSAIVVEQEQIGPTRYIAKLGILFDRARSGQLLGVSGLTRRSHPILVIPVMVTAGGAQTFESRTEWQKAWARFRTANSPIDYVRPVGNGIDPLLLNLPQTKRPGRSWWRMLLDQYGAADIVIPQVQLKRSFPGGPAIGIFTARHGPDNKVIARFALRAGNSASIPAMMNEGVRRIDAAYANALNAGYLTADPSLVVEEPAILDEIARRIEAGNAEPAQTATPVRVPSTVPVGPPATGGATSFTIQVSTPTAEVIGQAELAVSRVGGVTSALTTNPNVGGTSIMRVTFGGDVNALIAALRAQGWNAAAISGNSIQIAR